MKIYCVVTIDTECDRGLNWRNILPIRYNAVTDLIPNVFEKIFKKHGVKPTYLLSPEVLESRECVDVLKSLARVELGSHLHGEFVDPLKKPLGEFEGHYQAMYSPDVERSKLANLTKLFEERIGYKPTSFRAGRWSISPHTFQILESLGYLVDSSVTPYFVWKFSNHVVDHKTAPDTPYFPDNSSLLEVPVTLFSQYGSMLNKAPLPGWLKGRLLNVRLWRPKWLRPTYGSYTDMKSVIDAHIAFHAKEEMIVLNMMFHNVEILPNDNPYGFDSKRIALFLESMEKTFDYLNALNAKFAGLTDIYKIVKE